MGNQLPRRIRLDRNTPAELAIRGAVIAVEAAGCHPLLTEAVIRLDQAREKVADFVDGVEPGGSAMDRHSEDVKSELDGISEAAKYGPALLSEHMDELRGLVLTYSDAEADAKLVQFRSWFWGEALPSAVAKGGGA